MHHISILSLLVLCAAIARAQITDSTSLPQIEFSRLSQRDPNPLGQKALAIHPEQWKHGETEHFIYHFVDSCRDAGFGGGGVPLPRRGEGASARAARRRYKIAHLFFSSGAQRQRSRV